MKVVRFHVLYFTNKRITLQIGKLYVVVHRMRISIRKLNEKESSMVNKSGTCVAATCVLEQGEEIGWLEQWVLSLRCRHFQRPLGADPASYTTCPERP